MRLRLKIHSWNIWNNWNAEKVVKVVVEVDVLKEAEVLVQVWALRGDETTGLFKDRQLFFLNNMHNLSALASAAVWLSKNENFSENNLGLPWSSLQGDQFNLTAFVALLPLCDYVSRKYHWKFNHKSFLETYFFQECFHPLWSYLETFWPDS